MSLIPGNQTVLGNLTVTGDIVSFGNQVATDPYGSMRTESSESIVDLQATYPLSSLRTITQGTIPQCSTGEYAVSTNAADDISFVCSVQKGVSTSSGCEVTLSIRIGSGNDSILTGNQVARWGYYDGLSTPEDGFYFEMTAGNILTLHVVRHGVNVAVSRSEWNVDALDGTGPSGLSLDLTKGCMFKINYSAYGAIVFAALMVDPVTGSQFVQPIHRYVSIQHATVKPLHMVVTLLNNGTPGLRTICVGSLRFSMVGTHAQLSRQNTFVFNADATYLKPVTNSEFVPIVAIKKKSGFSSVSVRIKDLQLVMVIGDQLIQIRSMIPRSDGVITKLSAGVTNNLDPASLTWSTPLEQDAHETAVECCSFPDAVRVEGGIVVWTGMVSDMQKGTIQCEDIMYDLDDQAPLIVCARSLTGEGAAMNCMVRWTEKW